MTIKPHSRVGSIAVMEAIGDISTPALVVDLRLLESNLARMQSHVADSGIALRPHAKSHKSLEIGRRQIAAGAVGLTVGTLGEAEVFADGGITDIFIAYPLVPTGEKGRRLRELHERAQLRVGVDSAQGAVILADAVRGSMRPLDVLVECDSGERRTGVPPTAVGDVALAASRAGLNVIGAFTHGGHSYGGEAARRPAAVDEMTALRIAGDQLISAGCEVQVLSAGSTPTAEFSAGPPVTEQRPGTYVFNDANQVAIGSCGPHDVAIRVVSTVVSASAVPGQVIIDAGAKSLARDMSPLLEDWGVIPELAGSHLHELNDYHGYVRLADGANTPAIGRRVAVVPNHVCPVVNLFEKIYVVQDGVLVDEWPVDARAKSS